MRPPNPPDPARNRELSPRARTKRRRLSALAITGAVLAVSVVAHADDVVYLKDGGRIRGTVMEEQPDRGVTIRLADGSVRSVPTDEVKIVDYGEALTHPQEATPVPPTTPMPPPEEPRAPLTSAPVKLESNNPTITLDEVLSESAYSGGHDTGYGYVSVAMYGSTWRTRCTVPCGERLALNATYRIGGSGVHTSSSFVLPRGEGPMTLHVRAGSDAGNRWGKTLTIVGLLSAIPGATLLAVGIVETETKSDRSLGQTATQIGAATLIAGGVLLIPGIILWAANGTSVTLQDGHRLAKSGPRFTPSGLVF
jgi:hypothetical protein